uniref:Uncharacterized protein n=1 Tax=Caulobacter phage BL57 TaxID=3348355 RepID=A0AB74UGZ3_9VIRU
MKRPDVWIERDHGGRRFTLYDNGVKWGIRETCLHQPYMSVREWQDKLVDFFTRAGDLIPVYEDRERDGRFLGLAASFRDEIIHALEPAQ